jgi:MFS transporter, DHA2 family, multidrug resistance protein
VEVFEAGLPDHRIEQVDAVLPHLGGALGVAVLGSVVTTVFRSSVDSEVGELPTAAHRDEAHSGLAGALGVARSLAGDAGPALAEAAREAFLDGLTIAALTAAAAVTVAAISVRRLLPGDGVVNPVDERVVRTRTPEPVAGD